MLWLMGTVLWALTPYIQYSSLQACLPTLCNLCNLLKMRIRSICFSPSFFFCAGWCCFHVPLLQTTVASSTCWMFGKMNIFCKEIALTFCVVALLLHTIFNIFPLAWFCFYFVFPLGDDAGLMSLVSTGLNYVFWCSRMCASKGLIRRLWWCICNKHMDGLYLAIINLKTWGSSLSNGQFQDHHTLCSAVHLASMASDLLTEKRSWK